MAKKGRIVGLVKDFHHASLEEKLEPVIIYLNPKNTWMCFIKLQNGDVQNTIATIEKTYKSFEDEYPFDYRFISNSLDSRYSSIYRLGWLAGAFAFLAILISCLGLFALSAYLTQQKTKEVGVRKVLGASISHLVILFSKGFLGLVVLSVIIGVPVSWYLMNEWLNGFAFRLELTTVPFITAVALLFAIATFTVSYNIILVAKENPVKALRQE